MAIRSFSGSLPATYAPSKDVVGAGTYQTALSRWLQQQKESRNSNKR